MWKVTKIEQKLFFNDGKVQKSMRCLTSCNTRRHCLMQRKDFITLRVLIFPSSFTSLFSELLLKENKLDTQLVEADLQRLRLKFKLDRWKHVNMNKQCIEMSCWVLEKQRRSSPAKPVPFMLCLRHYRQFFCVRLWSTRPDLSLRFFLRNLAHIGSYMHQRSFNHAHVKSRKIQSIMNVLHRTKVNNSLRIVSSELHTSERINELCLSVSRSLPSFGLEESVAT